VAAMVATGSPQAQPTIFIPVTARAAQYTARTSPCVLRSTSSPDIIVPPPCRKQARQRSHRCRGGRAPCWREVARDSVAAPRMPAPQHRAAQPPAPRGQSAAPGGVLRPPPEAQLPAFGPGGGSASRPVRLLCYGDSLTAGYCAGGQRYEPYGRMLGEKLATAIGGAACVVSVCGHSGHTAAEMVANLDASGVLDVGGVSGKGLGRILDDEAQLPRDLVLIMAGTNDLGKNRSPQAIFGDICRLHAACHSRNVQTVALVPPEAPCAPRGSVFEEARQRLRRLLTDWAGSTQGVSAAVDASELMRAVLGAPVWDPDGLHFSPKGSQLVGQRLASIVAPLILGAANLAVPPGIVEGARRTTNCVPHKDRHEELRGSAANFVASPRVVEGAMRTASFIPHPSTSEELRCSTTSVAASPGTAEGARRTASCIPHKGRPKGLKWSVREILHRPGRAL